LAPDRETIQKGLGAPAIVAVQRFNRSKSEDGSCAQRQRNPELCSGFHPAILTLGYDKSDFGRAGSYRPYIKLGIPASKATRKKKR